MTTQEYVESAEVIFKGEIVDIDTAITVQTINSIDTGSKRKYSMPLEMMTAKFKIIQPIKGLNGFDYISVYTALRCCMCGFEFRQDATYVVFAHSDTISIFTEREITWDQQKLAENTQKSIKVLTTSTCSGTIEFNSHQLDEIISYLKARKNSR